MGSPCLLYCSKKFISVIALIILITLTAFGQDVKVTKVTDKVSVFNLTGISNCNIVAVSSNDGIILIDTETSPMTMEIIKDAIEKEFPGKKFIYVINTHAHNHHCGGNTVFKGVPMIANENIVQDMQWWFDIMKDEERKKKIVEYFEKNIEACETSIKESKDKSKTEYIKAVKDYLEKRVDEIKKGFEIVVPDIRFSDKMEIKLSDITLDLIYFGRGHSKSDILIYIAEEKVLVSGAVISAGLPSASPNGSKEKDISRWISVLNMLTEKMNDIDTVIPGHGNFMNNESIKLDYEYYSELYDKIKSMQQEGMTLDDAKGKMTLENGFSHFAQFANLPDKEKVLHMQNIEIFWNYIKQNIKVVD